MIDGASVPRWIARLLDRIDACSFAEVVGFVLNAESLPRRGAIERVWAGRSRLLYGLYSRVDARRFGAAVNPFDEIDLSHRLTRVPVLKVVPIAATPHEGGFDDDAITEIEHWNLDVILRFGFSIIPRAVCACARYGVWSYHHGDPDSYPGGPPLFWEIYDGAPVSGTVLQRLREEPDAGDLIYRSFSATDPISLHRSRTRTYWKSAEFVVRKLRDAYRDGELSVLQRGDRAGPKAIIHHTPTNRQMLGFGWRVMARVARKKARKALTREQWFIAYQRREGGLPTAETFRTANVLVPPRDRFYADPCLVEWGGSSYLFFEEFGFREQKGVVSYCQLTPDGRLTRPEIVLTRPYHISYPFVFFVGDEAYMLPETGANRAIELYRASSFPNEWALEAVLMSDIWAVDPTLIEHEGRYWLFTNVAVEGASQMDELFLFSAGSPRGPWKPHPRNPVVSDVRCARPSGRPFFDQNGSLIRPSQDCSGFYGSAIVFSRIEELSESAYRETPVGRLEPYWHPSIDGTHTYTCSETWEAVDGRAWVGKLGQSERKYARSSPT
jgi:hypothetical protein